ncbi:PfkB family carbohydrate kinase [Rhizobium sp. R693]|uniref:PfkB family carbohydrate kinase n=1 Tax=Rhizobium sp. R693 TaxID=1764276 RepID=UPI000B530EE8|nr:PfkB family carbohydrate kinase [Rhizobium sp. R693]OWV86819.1 hypothetical protein ATY79_08355 [Rhizobium sp. R693]
MKPVVTVGDCIIDEVRIEGEEPRRLPGGAALNLAVGVAKFGLASILITRVGQDREGALLLRYARERGVKIVRTPTVDPTGVAVSTRKHGEPAYSFNPAMYRRRILFDAAAVQAMEEAAVIAVNSFPFDNGAEASNLGRTLQRVRGVRVVDPNPRPLLIPDIAAYRRGVESILSTAEIVKVSDEDIRILFDSGWEDVATHLFSLGVGTILVSHGAGGARVIDRSGMSVAVPVADVAGDILDTMGAGDAMLATVISGIVERGFPRAERQWEASLVDAMKVAAATCRNPGAELILG